jgi:hypothetical protein
MQTELNKVDSTAPRVGFCEDKQRLLNLYLEVIRELVSLHDEQTKSVIGGDDDFTRFDVLIHVANQKKEQCKYTLMAHMEAHHC